MGVLGKLYNVIVYIHFSAVCMKLFESYVGRRIPLDNCMQWNSWFYMLIVAFKYKSAVNKYMEENLSMLVKDSLTP